MLKLTWSLALVLGLGQALPAGTAKGIYKTEEGEFSIGYALADKAADGTIRILLTGEEPSLADRDHNLDRLRALGEAAPGGFLMLEPTEKGDYFNITVNLDELDFGGGGQYESTMEISDSGVKGQIDTEVMSSASLNVDFDAEYLPDRIKTGDLPAGGGDPGELLLEQMQAVASGDEEAILRTLQPEQREQFAQMSEEEQKEALEFLVELTPRNVKVTGGTLYDGYAIVEFSGESDGYPVTGRALVASRGDSWEILAVSTEF